MNNTQYIKEKMRGSLYGQPIGYSSFPSYYVESLYNQAIYHQKITSFINQIVDEKA